MSWSVRCEHAIGSIGVQDNHEWVFAGARLRVILRSLGLVSGSSQLDFGRAPLPHKERHLPAGAPWRRRGRPPPGGSSQADCHRFVTGRHRYGGDELADPLTEVRAVCLGTALARGGQLGEGITRDHARDVLFTDQCRDLRAAGAAPRLVAGRLRAVLPARDRCHPPVRGWLRLGRWLHPPAGTASR